MTVLDWLNRGCYLPPCLRDFHDQKRLFKWLDRRVQKDLAVRKHPVLAHVYVIDFFLWAMALHGYTLQPTRRKPEGVLDLGEALKQFQDEEDARWREALSAPAPTDAGGEGEDE